MHPTLSIAIKAARRAGQIINRASLDIGQLNITTKQQNDFVTEVDKAAEAAIIETLREWVGKEIGPIAKPDEIRFGDNLPKTRSGKIMRRLLRDISQGKEITQDTSTLENPAILEQLKEIVR